MIPNGVNTMPHVRSIASNGSAAKDLSTAPKLSGIEAAKQLAAWTAVDHHVRKEHKVCISHLSFSMRRVSNNNQVIGIGSGTLADAVRCSNVLLIHLGMAGSTVPYVVERITSQGVELNKDRVFIPTGMQSRFSK